MNSADLGKRASDVAAMFDTVSTRYDRTNTVLSVGNDVIWRAATTKAVDPRPGERILDLAAGTGTSSAALAKSGAEIVAADFSAGMLEVGRRRNAGVRNLTFVHADALDLPFEDDEFDAVTMSFGLRNVEDTHTALSELYRVTKPGGRIVICEFSRPVNGVLRLGHRIYLRAAMPLLSKLSSSNAPAYDYLGDSIFDWADQPTLASWIRDAGYTDVAYRNLTGGVVALHRGTKPGSSR
ncbi:class I SAM-dependent methyltransferase [Herbiconiux sp. L3-i23]|uniref:class I SAM-dependent methyltransferase n=1 Tax=Herbiconiux sp. L3-i23 TaxID=2905871 RepID=UPI0020667FF6|nr:class I SAM-dependent methyltransferase [Herbiconiux sp. L3-i23]BDI21365.1 demethylmenaquinone methyltransferase [Herbiconiux sp. L3-i23]